MGSLISSKPVSRVIIRLKVGWDPHWGSFPNESGLRVSPVRPLGVVLAALQIDGAETITNPIAQGPLGNIGALAATTLRALLPIEEYLDRHLR